MVEKEQILEQFDISCRQEMRFEEAMKISSILTVIGLFIALLSIPVMFTDTAAAALTTLLIIGFGIAISGLAIITADIVIMTVMIIAHEIKIATIKLMAHVILKYLQLKAAEDQEGERI